MDKQSKIIDMFNKIAPTYDKANRAMSLGMDVGWRKVACSYILSKYINRDLSIVDVACGTGDMVGLWASMAKGYNANLSKLIGVDPSSGMLLEAKAKFPEHEFIEADANDLTLEDNIFDVLSISFGIRNVVEREEALKEFNRVLKIGGYAVVLEFTKTDRRGLFDIARDTYIKKVLPKIGEFISKDKEAYEYLPNSIDTFLSRENFIEELKGAGFEIEHIESFSFNACTLFVAKKIKNL
ncbi:bifunctional 2-octaprenyl-6-methoxy-1,4-benzoquinone methylase / S-adenosylmethionine:2-DMK methyltransferase [Campylobacter blaseri]|uniref:Demethylmenaquinone methyltransferase n=1 Tax=Campylobacter blaseri TaxID=2042961 RepID=A0A2P8R158_9BACT|nr:bifunctional demethylmenaquinone methyltransferase/2-methoxy-6-polyprenyl-1,4-benzoquinol methylase UbiE [Campylobacter blaseri]PSM52237.1 bifunctional demethylmenaquinone methyltransferase/2-methoxy-6-polyprenyl-1,4-benzoquinol methylase UbiE [Campylobacter blaseri]PSM54003.1 bifunctional demethylmenaquinone methyltransferase/2-methoxy-6-polyprenyl-1,4-benzoquinol methylase UbiE [Campylobacter blaseri]QKF85441.1 bifunctional 2-octaprenyl-6-methoxy-1,4-benzoquinone methylase / S-adenosylmethi